MNLDSNHFLEVMITIIKYNFRIRVISRGVRKLTRISILN